MIDIYQRMNQLFNQKVSRKDFLTTSVKALGAAAISPFILSGCKLTDDPVQAQKNVMIFYSKTLNVGIGKVTPEMETLVKHMFTSEECLVVQHLMLILGRTSKDIFTNTNTPYSASEIESILSSLAKKNLLFSYGNGELGVLAEHIDNRMPMPNYPFDNPKPPIQYALLPLLPGTFETSLVKGENTEWHRELGRLWENLFNTGYTKKLLFSRERLDGSRYIPIEKTINPSYATFPSDMLSEVLGASNSFGIGICQCKQARAYSGFYSCISDTMETCLVTGIFADKLIGQGFLRRIDRSEALDIKLKANESGIVTWGLNVSEYNTNFYCSCCKCCCMVLRSMTQFDAPGLHVKPNYLPQQKTSTNCDNCITQNCEKNCPTNAIKRISSLDGSYPVIDNERCIGCGLCKVSCSKNILFMERIENPLLPPANYPDMAISASTSWVVRQLKKAFKI